MVPLDCIPKLFTFSDENMPPEVRSQRTLNKSRIPEICNYILQNPSSYVFSALIASIDGEVCFNPASPDNSTVGTLSIAMSAKLLISIVLYHDIGLKRAQQMFSDLNRFAIRHTQSLSILYDTRGKNSIIVKEVIDAIPGFNTLVDKEHTSVPNRSVALFTLSAFYCGTTALLENLKLSPEEQRDFAIKFWTTVYKNMPEWQKVNTGEVKSSVVRNESLSPLSITIKALGEVGNSFYTKYPKSWAKKLKKLKTVDWSQKNKK